MCALKRGGSAVGRAGGRESVWLEEGRKGYRVGLEGMGLEEGSVVGGGAHPIHTLSIVKPHHFQHHYQHLRIIAAFEYAQA